MFMVLIGSKLDSQWHATLEEAVAPLGKLEVISADELTTSWRKGGYEIVTVDATYVKNVESVVSSLRAEQPERRIVVMTAAPGWKQARAAFEAGAIDYLPKTLTKAEMFKSFDEVRRKQPPPWPR